MIRALRCLAMGLAWTAIWPAYLGILALVARRAPWPRSVAVPITTILIGLALAALVRSLLCWIFRPSGWSVRYLDVSEALAAQLGRAGRSLVILALLLILPAYLLGQGEIAPDARPVVAPALSRFLAIGFELALFVYLIRVSRRAAADRMAAVGLAEDSPVDTSAASTDSPAAPASTIPAPPASMTAAIAEGATPRPSVIRELLRWLEQRRRLVPWFGSFVVLAIILLEARGYSFTARRLATGLSQSAIVAAICWAIYRVISKAIDEHAWNLPGPAQSWTRMLTLAMTSGAGSRLVAGLAPPRSTVPGGNLVSPSPQLGVGSLADHLAEPDHAEALSRRARQLLAIGLAVLGASALAWVWDLDLALLHTIGDKELWQPDSQSKTWVKLSELVKAVVYVLLGVAAWRNMNPFFAVFLFPRMSDDPGVRFAIVTLCRYAILGLVAILALGAIHLDMAKIGVVVAALGVGLGFGLQEVVSNFVCGIILLLERPIRIGDTVTVAGTSGRVDRINIRATTIVNADNQSMIVPNREFITGNLVNWTYRDKVIRVPIRLGVAYGTDPDRVVDLLQEIARADADVLRNPVPAAQMEGFGDSALLFGLYTFVPDPSLMGRVRHRLCAEIHRRFAEEGIQIPFPIQELHLNKIPDEVARAFLHSRTTGTGAETTNRIDPAARTPAGPHYFGESPHKPVPAVYKEEYCRGVDE